MRNYVQCAQFFFIELGAVLAGTTFTCFHMVGKKWSSPSFSRLDCLLYYNNSMVFFQASDAISRGFIHIEEHDFELKALREAGKTDSQKQIEVCKWYICLKRYIMPYQLASVFLTTSTGSWRCVHSKMLVCILKFDCDRSFIFALSAKSLFHW